MVYFPFLLLHFLPTSWMQERNKYGKSCEWWENKIRKIITRTFNAEPSSVVIKLELKTQCVKLKETSAFTNNQE